MSRVEWLMKFLDKYLALFVIQTKTHRNVSTLDFIVRDDKWSIT